MYYLQLMLIIFRDMRQLIVITLFYFFTSSAFAQPTIEVYLTSQPFPSKGPTVESFEDNYELLIKNVPQKPIKIITQFNREGLISSETKFGKGGGKTSETKWEYSQSHKLTKKTHKYFVNTVGWKIDETTLTYNDTTGFLSEIRFTKNGVQNSMSKVFCDSIGRPKDIRVLDGKGAYIMNEKVVYSPNVNVVRVMEFKPTNQYAGKYTYPLDPSKPFQTNQVDKQYYPNGDLMLDSLELKSKTNQGYYYEYNYDGYGNWIEKNTYQVTLGKNNKIKDKKLEHRITRVIKYY